MFVKTIGFTSPLGRWTWGMPATAAGWLRNRGPSTRTRQEWSCGLGFGVEVFGLGGFVNCRLGGGSGALRVGEHRKFKRLAESLESALVVTGPRSPSTPCSRPSLLRAVASTHCKDDDSS